MPAWTWLGWELMPEHAKEVTPVVVGMMAPSLWQRNRGVYLVEVPDLLFVAGLPDTITFDLRGSNAFPRRTQPERHSSPLLTESL